MKQIVIFTVCFLICAIKCEKFTIKMPGVQPKHRDHYLCTAVKLRNESMYIRKFSVKSDASKAHHMILFGCKGLSEDKLNPNYWNCGSGYICDEGMSIKYAWAKNAPPTNLPTDVGFEIGSEASKAHYLVLQVHYVNKLKPDEFDDSSITLDLSKKIPKYLAGIHLLLASHGKIRAHSLLTHIDVNCQLGGTSPIHVFAYRTHAHTLGTVITGYRYRPNSSKWQKIAKGNPRWPQAFYPMDKVYDIQPDDFLVSRCTYNASKREYDTKIGSTEHDEMCNLYLMFYVDSNKKTSYRECFDVQEPSLVMDLPKGNDVPLTPNPALEDIASGHEHAHKIIEHPDLHYKGEELKLDYKSLGQISAVTLDANENLFVFHRGDKVWNALTFDLNNFYRGVDRGPIKQHSILHVDPKNGKILAKYAKDMFYMPHGLTYDKNGFLWATDVALHQIKKLKIEDGKIVEVMSLGQKFHPGSDSNHFCKPTSVAVATDGSFYVADGYCNSRIMKFSKDGKFLAQFGYPTPFLNSGSDAPPGSFQIPHKILLIESKKLLCVADRENGRVQCFKLSNNKINNMIKADEFGERVFSIAYSPANGGLLYAVNNQNRRYPTKGFIIDIDQSNVIAKFSPSNDQKLNSPHDLAVSADGQSIFVVEIGPNKIWQFHLVKNGKKGVVEPIVQTEATPVVTNSPNTIYSNINEAKINKTVTHKVKSTKLSMTLTILALLAIPILILIIVSVIIQMRKRGMCKSSSRTQDKFNVGNFLNRHKGFDRLSTQEDDLDAIDSSDSDIEEFSVNRTKA